MGSTRSEGAVEPKARRVRRWRAAAVPSAGYAVVGGVWILASDRLTALVAGETVRATLTFQTLKGLGFIAVTAIVLFFTVWWLLARHEAVSVKAARFARELVTLRSRTTEGIVTVDADGAILSANPRAAAMLGTAAPELRGRRVRDFVRADQAKAADRLLADWMADRAGPADLPLAAPDGATTWALVQGFPHGDAWGGTTGAALLLSDVTDRKRAEEALRLRESAIEAASDGIVITDARAPDNPLVYVNPAFEAMTGYSAAEAIGRNCRFLQGDDRDQPALDEVRDAIANARPTVVEVRNYRSDGTPFWNELRIAPVRDRDGRPTHFVGVQTDVTERRRARERLEAVAYQDALTGLLNRQAFTDAVAARLAEGARDGRDTVVFIVDLYRLRDVNQTRGYASGDRILLAVADRLRATLGPDAPLARLSSGAFAGVLDPATARADVLQSGERLRDALLVPHHLPGETLVVGTSTGLAVGPPGIGASEMLQRADMALFAAKEAGRDKVVVYDRALGERNRERIAVTEGLRSAIAEEQFELHFQPKVAIETGLPTGAEALMRWNHPADGLRMPGSFIPVAEESGLIVEMGAWALETTVARLTDWTGGPLAGIEVAVNVSERQLVDDRLADRLAALLRDSGCPGERLTL